MSAPNFHSVRRHFGYDAERSSLIKGTYFFEYLHPFRYFENEEVGDRIHRERIFVVIGSYKLTLKLEVLAFNKAEPSKENSLSSTRLEDLLTVPLDTKHNNFAEIETQLIRLKQKEQKKEELKNKQGKSTFEQILQHFIEDLYVHKYFKECGDTQKLKSALEHVPLIQGIIRKFLFDYYCEDCIHFRKKDIRTDYKQKQLEDAYLNYSRFLSQPENERLFLPGGWFVQAHNKVQRNIDNELFENVESKYISIYKRFEGKGFFVSPFKNTRHILTRYGIVDLLRLVLPRGLANLFVPLLAAVVVFIVAYIGIFQYTVSHPGKDTSSEISESLLTWIEQGLKWSALLFLAYTIGIFAYLILDKNKRTILPGIFLPRLTIAIIAALWALVINESLFKVDMDINGGLLLFIGAIVLFVIISFMSFEISNYAPAMIFRKRLKRSLIVIMLAFVVSYTFGFWSTAYITKKHLSVSGHFLVKESKFAKEFERRENYYKIKLSELKQRLQEDSNPSKLDTIVSQHAILHSVGAFGIIDSCFRTAIEIFNNEATDTIQMEDAKQHNIARIDSVLNRMDTTLKSTNHYFFRFLKHNNSSRIEVNETVVYYLQYDNLTIFPNMLLSRTLLAMFIGIFLQLMTRGKPITEPI